MGEVIYLPKPNRLTPEQRQHWHSVAAEAEFEEEKALLDLQRAQRKREDALRILGMLGAERGLDG